MPSTSSEEEDNYDDMTNEDKDVTERPRVMRDIEESDKGKFKSGPKNNLCPTNPNFISSHQIFFPVRHGLSRASSSSCWRKGPGSREVPAPRAPGSRGGSPPRSRGWAPPRHRSWSPQMPRDEWPPAVARGGSRSPGFPGLR